MLRRRKQSACRHDDADPGHEAGVTTVRGDNHSDIPELPRSWGARGLWGAVRFYQLAVSPLLAPACRYYPTCSNYALEAIVKYGALKGGWLALRRLLRCHPFRPGGFDPVP